MAAKRALARLKAEATGWYRNIVAISSYRRFFVSCLLHPILSISSGTDFTIGMIQELSIFCKK